MGASGGNVAGLTTDEAGGSGGRAGARALSTGAGGLAATVGAGVAATGTAPATWEPAARPGGGGSGPSTVAQPANTSRQADTTTADIGTPDLATGPCAICGVETGDA